MEDHDDGSLSSNNDNAAATAPSSTTAADDSATTLPLPPFVAEIVAAPDADVLLPNPKTFYQTFVAKRRPVILRQASALLLDNPSINSALTVESLLQLSSKNYEYKAKSSKVVQVNVAAVSTVNNQQQPPSSRSNVNGSSCISFSPHNGSRVISIAFESFCLRLLSQNDDCNKNYYYMTTQTLPLDDEGRPSVCSWLSQLLINQRVVPLRPTILGNLIPMSSAGLWLGSTSSSSTTTSTGTKSSASSCSGLHHDMHDNLYCLIHGKKTIRVAPPETIRVLQMAGQLHHLHQNGRIVYQQDLPNDIVLNSHGSADDACPIRPDGALASVERIMELEIRRDEITSLLDDITAIDDNSDQTTKQEQREALEAELDQIEEELLDNEMMDDGNEGNDDDEEEEDDHDDFSNDDDDDHDDPSNAAATRPPSRKKAKFCTADKDADSRISAAQCIDDDDLNCCVTGNEKEEEERLPLNFALGDTSQAKFETIELSAGDALYLPAGWFHEVFSQGGIHLAVNYWVHPPDVVDVPAGADGIDNNNKVVCFERPYKSQFWQRDWDARQLEQKNH